MCYPTKTTCLPDKLETQIRKQHKPPPKTRIWKLRKPVEDSINSSTFLSDPDSEADVE